MNVVIKPWLSGALIAALIGSALFSGILIVKLNRFDAAKQQADEAKASAAMQRTELAKLQVEVETLTKRKDVLAPTVADWEKRLKEMHDAQAAADSLGAKQRQAESDAAQASKRLEDANRVLLEAQKQKTDLASAVERLKSERDSLTISNTDAKALARQAEEAERRLNGATNALASVEARRKQLGTDTAAAQTRFEQIQKEAEDLRLAREKLTTDLAALRQQVQAQKDLLAKSEQAAVNFKALQTATQQEEQNLAKLRQQSSTAEARTSDMESRLGKAASELAQLTNRLDQARKEGTESESRLATANSAFQRAASDLATTQKRLTDSQASQDQSDREQVKLTAQIAAARKDLEQARKDGADAEARRDTAKAESQKADADLAAARAQLQVFVVKQGELTRDTSRLETTVERLKQEKETLEKEIGRQEAQRQKTPSAAPK